jgi:hypothetical protein
LATILVAALTTGWVTRARAAPDDASSSSKLVPLYLHGDSDGLQYELRSSYGIVVARCTSPCVVMVRSVSYRVHVDGPKIPARTIAIEVEGPTQVYTKTGWQPWNTIGLVTAVVGTVAAPLALVAGFSTERYLESDDRPTRESKQKDGRAWFYTGAALAVIGISGWIVFAATRTKMEDAPVRAPVVSWGVAPTDRGGSFALRVSF